MVRAGQDGAEWGVYSDGRGAVVIDLKKAYAWAVDGKFFLSRLPKRDKPKNTYETRDALAAEARGRGITVVWIDAATH